MFRSQVVPAPGSSAGTKRMTQCGAATVLPRKSSIFPRITGLESCKKWLKSFFYVRNTTKVDQINLPAFVLAPPTEKHNWTLDPKELLKGVNDAHQVLVELVKKGLTADDLLIAFIISRICPLQRRSRKICYITGHRDPTRMSTFKLTKPEVLRRIKAIATTHLTPALGWNVAPHSVTNPITLVSIGRKAILTLSSSNFSAGIQLTPE